MAAVRGLSARRTCGTQAVHRRLLTTSPDYVAARDEIETAAYFGRGADRVGVVSVPVVVHVVGPPRGSQPWTVTDAQVRRQVETLTADFRAANPDRATVPAPFAELVADAEVTFVLADRDPDGQPTSGITRTVGGSAQFGTGDEVKSAAAGGADPWPADRYLNVWVCNLGGGLLGYAQFPGGPAATDGVVITYSGFGSGGSARAPFDLGRTTTHEVGHWLNLFHIWGDDGTGCAGSDEVADTPNAAGPNYGRPTFPHVSCANGPDGDLFMNFLDYVDDAAMTMFTAGQVARMKSCLSGARSSFLPDG